MSGIPGGYRLVSTYDLLDCKTILKFEILKFSDWGEGVFWVTWNLDLGKKTKVFNLGGVFLGHLGFGLYDNFHFGGGGYSGTTSDLDSVKIFILGGYSGTPRIWTLWQFSFCGGILGHLGFQLCDNFHLWGILGHLGFGLYDNFHFGGRYSGTPQIWTLWQYSLGGYSGTPRIWTLWQFSFCGGILGHLRFGFYDNFHFGGGRGRGRERGKGSGEGRGGGGGGGGEREREGRGRGRRVL